MRLTDVNCQNIAQLHPVQVSLDSHGSSSFSVIVAPPKTDEVYGSVASVRNNRVEKQGMLQHNSIGFRHYAGKIREFRAGVLGPLLISSSIKR